MLKFALIVLGVLLIFGAFLFLYFQQQEIEIPISEEINSNDVSRFQALFPELSIFCYNLGFMLHGNLKSQLNSQKQ